MNSEFEKIGCTRITLFSLFLYTLFFYDKEVNIIKQYSNLFHMTYEDEEVRYIPNMQQNYKYLNSTKSQGQLVDIICGNENRIVFVWRKSKEMDELYKLWCERKL